jgi:predicted RNA-binding Zn-ribbon protein involved in translation (DUF1610 family)
MDHIGEQIENIKNMQVEDKKGPENIKCVSCGTNVQFSENQYKRYCPKCGLSISLSTEGRKTKPKANKKYNCFICQDDGIIIYHAQVDGRIYEFAARCVCPVGNKMGEAIPLITQCQMAPTVNFMEAKNGK